MVWPGSKEAKTFDTGAPAEVLQKAGKASVDVPAGFVRIFSQSLVYEAYGHSSGDPS